MENILTSKLKIFVKKMLSGHYWELIWYWPLIPTTSIINISSRNEHSSLHIDTRSHQLLVKTSIVWDLQVFSKLVESIYYTNKNDKYNPINQNPYDFNAI